METPNFELQGFYTHEDLSLSGMNGENAATLAGVIAPAFVITFSCINNAASTEKDRHINPLQRTRPQTLDGDLFSDRVWAGPVGWVIYLCLAGKSSRNHNTNPHPDRIGTSGT